MAAPLDRLGRRCVRHRAVVLVAWAVALAGVLAASHAAGLRTSSDPALPGTQSDRARKVVEREVQVPAGAPGRVVYGVDAGTVTAPRFRAAIEASMARVRAAPHVASVTSPFTAAGRQGLSPGRKVAYASVWLDIDAEDLLDGDADAIVAAARDEAPPDLQVAFGGTIGHKAAPTPSTTARRSALPRPPWCSSSRSAASSRWGYPSSWRSQASPPASRL
jgi:putative drug exporter of the RND superfamily